MSDTKKKYNLTLARGYKTSKGFWSVDIGPEEFDAIQKIEVGGRLSLNVLSEESRKKESSPHAYFEYIDADTNKANKAKFKASKPAARTDSADEV